MAQMVIVLIIFAPKIVYISNSEQQFNGFGSFTLTWKKNTTFVYETYVV